MTGPEDAYLAWWYVDSRSAVRRSQVFHRDGRVELVEGDRRTTLCTFSPAQVAAAQAAIVDSGLAASDDIGAGVHDAAVVTYWWRIDDSEGQVTNSGYPLARHDAIERLDRALAELEEAAGGWPLYADE
jgi:hypothetical protein